MPYKCEQPLEILNQQMQKQQQKQLANAIESGAVQEFLIDDPLHFSMLEKSAKQQQLRQQQSQYAATPSTSNAPGGSGAGGPFTLTLDEHKRKVEAGYVSLNDSYTACSSVYGVGSSTSSGATGHDSTGNSADPFAGSDLRTAKIGHMMTAAATAAVAASHSAKSTTVRSGPIIL